MHPGFFRCESAFTNIMGLAASQEIVARWCEEIDHLSIFSEPCLMLRACWNDHDVA